MDFATYAEFAHKWALQAVALDPVDPIKALYAQVNDTRIALADRKRVRRCAEAMIRLYRGDHYGPLGSVRRR